MQHNRIFVDANFVVETHQSGRIREQIEAGLHSELVSVYDVVTFLRFVVSIT